MSKNIRLGVICIADFDASQGKMFSWNYYYDKNDEFHDKRCEKEVKACDPKEIVLPPNREYLLKITYPVSKPYTAKIRTGKKGLTRLQLADKVCKHYRKMYDEDGKTSTGKYGVWGHDITDLVLVDADVSSNGVITLGVDS